MIYRRFGKRIFDLVLAIPGLVIISPLLAGVALLVRMGLGTPILFRQERPGLHGKPFMLLKFRTMTDARDAQGRLLSDAERLTPLGRFLRKFSLDELPQLLNVLRGEMSLIGPRPLITVYLSRYSPEHARRHDVRPGITGLAQISGRNALPFSQRLAYDVVYVDQCSLSLDFKILVRTLYLVALGKLFDGAGQHVSVVDDLGLSTEIRALLEPQKQGAQEIKP